MSEIKHTPTPWAYEEGVTPFYNDVNGHSCGGDGTGTCEIFRADEAGNSLWDLSGELDVVDVFSVENAAFIVLAVNSYESDKARIAALEEANERLRAYREWLRQGYREMSKWTTEEAASRTQQYSSDTLTGPTQAQIDEIVVARSARAALRGTP